ncbi:GRIP and coiled-coil domain-containing protein 1-like [Argiope bruennichi]|uniref:GRIP and coiled-coil domain-containing protein like n=1 Tax=Argiope bruennichi TaxID=94029 RepID=A0A8T0E8X3_ARGBR|nr:GRIP and coiled-coil domain-containing protein 1-like [Argiope bruennichi]KAF8767786.1 GRIP and coiled-coil domain-containing protein like [Argiope bruennichi]
MERKSKKELLSVIEDQNQNLLKYKSRLHDIVESYKNLLREKETLENSIKTLTAVSDATKPENENEALSTDNENQNDEKISLEERNDQYLQQLRSSLGALTIEKSRIENELRADRKKILQQKEEVEKSFLESENAWAIEKDRFENQILELRKKVSAQQREREKEQQDHVLMLKELQNVLANERAMKEKLENQISELQQRYGGRISERKVLEYEKTIDELQNKLIVAQDRLRTFENEAKRNMLSFQKFKEEMEDMKAQLITKANEEKKRADMTEEKLKLLTFVKEKRIASLEGRLSELSTIVGDHDKVRQQDQLTIQKLKARITQLQVECSAFTQIPRKDSKIWDFNDVNTDIQYRPENLQLTQNTSEETHPRSDNILHSDAEKDFISEKSNAFWQAEIMRMKEELEQYKAKAESALKEKYTKTSAALLSDAKSGKEIKELKSKITQLQNQLQNCKSQLKLNEEYHNKITSNLEKTCEDLKLQHKQELAQVELSHRTQLLELEHQIQKQRERTLALLEEKDKEIELLKSSFLSSFIKKNKTSEGDTDLVSNIESATVDTEAAASLLSSSLISSQKEGHILHYIQELARKDVEISNLRQSRIQTEASLRKLQQALAVIEEKYNHEVEMLKSRIKLLESSQDEEGTNIEYLKNVVFCFLKCNDPQSKRHMVNAIATVLHFTTSEIQDIKAYIK